MEKNNGQNGPAFYKPPIRKKTRMIKIFLTSIIIIILTVVSIYLLIQENSNRFYGTWELKIIGLDLGNSTIHNYWTFYDNGDLKITELTTSFYEEVPIINFQENTEEKTINVKSLGPKLEQWGSYTIESGKLYISGLSDTEIPVGIGLDCSFINENEFIINLMMVELNFRKITESTIQYPAYNFGDVKWEDINISVNVGYGLSEKINWNKIKLTRSTITYSGEHAPPEWNYVLAGDKIEIGNYMTGTVIVRMIWIPTNKIFKTIFFNEV